ncbi:MULTISPECIES: hypothetical protein [unclassified Streptomyces]|uniref:hypothetical protein n=1 Tax=unclassified Streptomyces TaxID=2593676 RepID=UPI0004C6A307|nr:MULTISPECIES: hypothetical protein [unclassified Streptomyces]KOV86067.1 hypothetical protein ADL02_19420 [Streptomyces sp. NRRL WC-3723]
MAMEALGRLVDVCIGAAPVDLSSAAVTGKRVSLKNCGGLTIVVFKGAGTAGDDPTFTLKQHTANTGGTTSNLAIIDHYYLKSATTLAGTESWTRVSQSAAATIADPGGAGTSAESQQIIAIEVDAAQLSDGYTHVSLDCADVGTNAQLGAILYLRRDLTVERAPASLAASL